MRNISQEKLRSLRIWLPPTAEQKRIVAAVEERASRLDAAETSLRAALKRAQQLQRSIFEQAFTGRLVPQDPDDEPASVLLERLTAERTASKPARKRGWQRAQPRLEGVDP